MLDLTKMQAIAAEHETISDKIRALDRAGYRRADIARFLGRRYQHVRNVLVADEQTQSKAASRPRQGTDADLEQTDEKGSLKVRVGEGGEVMIPAAFRERLGIKSGDVLFARIEEGELHLLTPAAAMRRAHAIVRQFVPDGVSLVNELIEDRRRDVQREAERG